MESNAIKRRYTYFFKTLIIFNLSCLFLISGKNVVAANANVNQQQNVITGTVTDESGIVMPGVNVVLKGTTSGTITDLDGKYTIHVPDNNSILVFSFLGYATIEKTVGSQRTLNVSMGEDATLIDEVVVTALGIVRKEKSLTYSTQIVDGGELTRAKDPNMINSLAGKTAGVQINKSSSGLGGSVKVVIRGNRSVSGSNQPLYVIDGVPINSSANDQTSTTIGGNNDSGNIDRGDGISNLNPDDIESMNILKGPAAAALYGSSAANGVVVITTKKGKAGRTEITFNSNTTFEKAAYGIPEFQNSYGGVSSSWGDKLSGGKSDYTDDFFQTGVTTINSVSLSSGSEARQTYFSYANTYGEGVVENNKLKKHNFNFRETANFFNNKLTVDANINLMHQLANNRAVSGGYYMNPLVGLYHFPRGGSVQGGESFSYYKNNYQYMDAGRNMYLQNWYPTGLTTMEQNPYWLINKTPSEDKRVRGIAGLSLKYKINDYFTLQGRGNADYISDKYEQKIYAGTHAGIAGGNNGRYIFSESTNMSLYGDAMLTYQQYFNNFMVNATIGASINDNKWESSGADSAHGQLYNPNIFTLTNIDLNAGAVSQSKGHTQSQSIFFAGQIGYRDMLFLDVTARNDWTSSLAFTDSKNSGFFYPSVGLTWIMNETLKLPEWVTLGKVRGAWSQVGNGLPTYLSNPLHSINTGGNVNFNTTAPFSELEPEKTTSVEVGTEWRFFGSRLEFDFTYYNTNTKNQLFTLDAPSGSQYTQYYVNAGNIRNRGIEIMLSGTPVLTESFRWKTGLNYSLNRNKVIELAEGLGYFIVSGASSNAYTMRLEVGGSFGDLYGYKFLRDEQGNISYDAKGMPIKDDSDYQKIGNTSPKFNLGWQNTLSYKNFSLYFLIDGRFGGDVLSLTQSDLDQYGVSKTSGDARLNGGVMFHGKKIEDVQGFYNIVGGRSGVSEHYIYSATNIRLRELSLGYTLPNSVLKENSFIKNIEIAFIGRNLFFFKNDAPYDPDGTLSTGNSLQGVDVFGMPTNRSFGINLKANF